MSFEPSVFDPFRSYVFVVVVVGALDRFTCFTTISPYNTCNSNIKPTNYMLKYMMAFLQILLHYICVRVILQCVYIIRSENAILNMKKKKRILYFDVTHIIIKCIA